MRFSSRRQAIRLAMVVWALANPCAVVAQPQRQAVRRPLQHSALGFVTLADISLPAIPIQGGGTPRSIKLGPLPGGTIELSVGMRGHASVATKVTLRLESADEADTPTCSIELVPDVWHACRLPVTTPRSAAALAVVMEGCEGAHCYLSSPIVTDAAAASAAPPIIVLLVDTLRANCLATYNEALPIGSAIARLAADSIVFEQARSSTSWTRPAVASLFTGHSAQMHGVNTFFDALPEHPPVLAEIMQSAGYRTAAWSANSHIIPQWGFQRGFDRFTLVQGFPKARAPQVLPPVADHFEELSPAPWFVYIHLLDPHEPYDAPPLERAIVETVLGPYGTFAGGYHPRQINDFGIYKNYLGEVLRLDVEIGAFLDRLRRIGVYDRALIVFLADHGEEFLDHNALGHGWNLYDETLRIPLFLKLPGSARAGERILRPVAIEDVFPTILASIGVRAPGGLEGTNMLHGDSSPGADRPRFAKLMSSGGLNLRSVVVGTLKYIAGVIGGDQLFDLSTDPGERTNLYILRGEAVGAMQRLLEEQPRGGESGWHVRACAGEESESLWATFDGNFSDIRAVGFEQEDNLSAVRSNRRRARLRLRPAREVRAILATMGGDIPRARRLKEHRDVDEIVIPQVASESGLTLLRVGPVPVAFTIGSGGLQPEIDEIALDGWADIARVNSDRAPACDLKNRLPYLRIWHVPLPRVIARDSVDPLVKDRLRALGYDLDR